MPLNKETKPNQTKTIGKWLERMGSLALVRKPVWEKENSQFKQVFPRLKIELVSRDEGFG